MTSPNFSDIENLSALLDEKLSTDEARRLRARLAQQADLRAAYENLQQARAILRQLPPRRAPRNFSLSRQLAGIRPPTPRLFPFLQWATALTAIFFFFSLGLNTLTASAPAAEAPMLAAAEALPAATEAMPALAAPPAADPGADLRSLAPAPTEAKQAAAAQNAAPIEEPAPAAPGFSWPPLTSALAGLTILLALAAWGLRWRAEQKFKRMN